MSFLSNNLMHVVSIQCWIAFRMCPFTTKIHTISTLYFAYILKKSQLTTVYIIYMWSQEYMTNHISYGLNRILQCKVFIYFMYLQCKWYFLSQMGNLRVLYIFHGVMYPVSIKMFPTEQHRLMEEGIYLTCIAYSISPRIMPMVWSLVCLLWFGTHQDHPYPSGLRHRHRNNHTIAPVPMKLLWMWVNPSW